MTGRSLNLSPVYPITLFPNDHGMDHLELVRRFLDGGARFLQVRDKMSTDRNLLEQLREIRDLCRSCRAQVIVNDRVDLVLAVDADGVHLGQDDMPAGIARRLLGPNRIIGLSTHTREEFLEAQKQDIDYVAAGPVFPTGTKSGLRRPLGPDLLSHWVALSRLPVVAIGGINLQRAPLLWHSGVASVAVVSDIANAPDPGLRVRDFLKLGRETK